MKTLFAVSTEPRLNLRQKLLLLNWPFLLLVVSIFTMKMPLAELIRMVQWM